MTMTCQQAQRDMQKALDRRLPQIEQRAFQEHILSCQSCRYDFDRYKKLQAWTHELPSSKPASNFSKRLFERIQSGEGSPEGILHQPVPILRKLHIFGSGAVTAAALLLGAFLIFETMGNKQDDGSIAFEPILSRPDLGAQVQNRPDSYPNSGYSNPGRRHGPMPVSDPVKGAEMALNNALIVYETARGLQTVPHLNKRTFDSIRNRGQDIERSMAFLAELFQRGEIRLALEGDQGSQFQENMEKLRAHAELMQIAPQDWLLQGAAERERCGSSIEWFVSMGKGFDPSTRLLRRCVIVRGKCR
jgi:Putative zinc-finger